MIPIYRAKRIDNDEYVEGYLLPEYKGKLHLSIKWTRDFDGLTPNFIQIDPSTLAIHFPNMLDSQGNKIFASLQEDGKGGDIVVIKDTTFEYTYKYIKGRFILGECMDLLNPFLLFEQRGIQE